MSEEMPQDRLHFDPDLLDRMTGAKGNVGDIEAKCHSLLSALCPILETAFDRSAGVLMDVRPGAIRQGRRRQLLKELSQDCIYCEGTVAEWSNEIAALCGSGLIIGMVECLLGGSSPDDLDIEIRPLSAIELDMSLVIFEQLNDSLRTVVSRDRKARTSVSKPKSSLPKPDDDPVPDFHAAALTFDITFGPITAPLILILPQAQLLKTTVVATSAKQKKAADEAWAERLNKRISQSEVNLQATVELAPLQLGEISRLQPGDLIAFSKKGDIEVTLNANGKSLYTCALGKTGQRYMVKIEGHSGPDENWKSDFA